MGCQQSKIDDEEAVTRCKERKQLMKTAVSARNAFAAAHTAYVVALKQTGSALSDYGQSEMGPNPPASSSSSAVGPSASAPVSAMPQAPLPPPPPPLPNFSPSPLMRSASMPDLPIPKPRRKKDSTATITEEDDVLEMEDEEDRGGDGGVGPSTSSPVPPPPPLPPRDQPTPPRPPTPLPQQTDWDYFFSVENPSLTETHPEILPGREERVDDSFKRPSSSTSASDVPGHAGGSGGEINPPVTPEKVVMGIPPKPQRRPKQGGGSNHHQHTASAGVSETKRGKPVSSSSAPVNLVQMLIDLDEHFLRASESATPVSRMLEATRLHYHSNFADNRGHIDHSARVMKVITWNKSFKGLPNDDDGNDDFDNEELETHATVLDKLLAWEKKLYDEVKAGEIMKIKYQKKLGLLNKQKKHGANPNTLETTKATVSHLHTRYIVDMQSMDSTVSEIQRLRDHQLYPKLASLVDGMATMWETMHKHHDSQLKIVMDIRSLDISSTPKETTQKHYELTVQLYKTANEWHSEFQKLVNHQKEYIQALSGWLRLNVIPVESNLKEKVSSPTMVLQPPIQALVYAWQDQLGKLPDDIALHAVFSFAAVINAIMAQQQEELKQKDKRDAARKEYQKRHRIYADWLDKYNRHRKPADEADQEGTDNENQNDEMVQRQLEVELLQKRVEEEEENYRNLCKQVREKAVGSLKMHMPELFRAISDFAQACSKMYKYLRSIPQKNSHHGADS